MKKNLLMKLTPILFLFLLFAFNCKINAIKASDKNTNESPEDEVKKAFIYMWNFFNNEDLTDSLTFNKLKLFYAYDYVILGSKGKPPTEGEATLEWIRGFVKTRKPNFDVTIDRLEVSGDLAYILFHYHEVFTDIETGEKLIDVNYSAFWILRKDAEGNWRIVVSKFI